jgi:cobalt-zinc-cadmium efflux system protein
MLVAAVGGLVVNLIAARACSPRAGHNENTRAPAHVPPDAAGSVAAIVAAVLILVWGWRRADPLISVALAGLIFWGAWRLVARTVDVLMEGTPAGLVPEDLERTIRETPGVAALHDLHAWTISEGFEAVTVHVVLDGSHHGPWRRCEIRERHHIDHVTVQPGRRPPPSPSSRWRA